MQVATRNPLLLIPTRNLVDRDPGMDGMKNKKVEKQRKLNAGQNEKVSANSSGKWAGASIFWASIQ